MERYIEVAVYRLKSEITIEQFIQASDAALTDFEKLDGFLRREISKSEDGQWLDLVYYNSHEAAKAAEPVLSVAPKIQAVMAMLDMENMHWFHAIPIRRYSN